MNAPNGGTDGTKLYAGFYDLTDGWQQTAGYTISTGTWYNGVVTYNGSTLLLYLNNVVVSTLSISSTSMSSSLGYRVGRRWDNYDSIDGYIPVAMVYNRALSASEISQNFGYFRGRYGV